MHGKALRRDGELSRVSFCHPKAPGAPSSPWCPRPSSSTALSQTHPWSFPSPVLSPDSSMSHAQGPAWPSLQPGYRTVSKSYSPGGFGLELLRFLFDQGKGGILSLRCHPYSNQQPLPVKQVTHQTPLHSYQGRCLGLRALTSVLTFQEGKKKFRKTPGQ